MSAGAAMEEALRKASGICGPLALALEKRRGVPREVIQDWVTRLRAAADALEALLK